MFCSQSDYDCDAYCPECGRGYNFEVGIGGDRCPHCGWSSLQEASKNPKPTPTREQLLAEYQAEFQRQLHISEQRVAALKQALAQIRQGTFDVDHPPWI